MAPKKNLLIQIEQIKGKLNNLREADEDCKQFGSHKHRYELNTALSEEQITEFEFRYSIKLPEDYSLFLKTVGNGGAGPFYGVEKLSEAVFEDLDYKREGNKINLLLPFPHSKSWNLDYKDFTDYQQFEEAYFAKEHSNGLLRLCNFGCGVFINLVVNGEEYGKMWTDDRGNNCGIYPSTELGNESKICFLDWYELWLDNNLEELNK